MRLTFEALGISLDISICRTDAVQESVQDDDRGFCTSYPVGFVRSLGPDWERPLNTFDEPSEGDEDT